MARLSQQTMYALFSLVLCLGFLWSISTNSIAQADTTIQPYAFVNGDYEQPLNGSQIAEWGSWTQLGTVSLDPRAHSGNHSLNLTNGFIAAWNSTAVVNSSQDNAPHPGDLVQASVWVQVPDATTDLSKPFQVWVEEVDGSGNKHLIASAQLPGDAPRGQWFHVTTSPVDGGIIQSSTQNLVVSFQDYVTGTILVDDFQVGYLQRGLQSPSQSPKPLVYTGINPSFESGMNGWGSWASTGPVNVVNDGYYGQHAAQLENPSDTDSSVLWQTIPTGASKGLPHVGDTVEAGAWVRRLPDATQTPGASLKLQVEGVSQEGTKTLLAQSVNLSDLPVGVWTYVLTQPISGQTVTSNMTGVVVSVQDSMKGGVLVDYVQAGQVNSLTGAPQKFVIGEYQPWYGATGRWHNWAWSDSNVVHNPDIILPNGERDISAYYYPLVGAYDSTDPSLLQYHVDLMKAMGVDCILVDWYAALQPDYAKAFNELLDIADKSDMKVAIFYEPKIHTFNWIPASSRQEQISAITQDITNYLGQYGNHKSVLKVRGRPVVGVFGATNTGLTSSDWASILQTIHHQNYDPYMIGDVAATDPPSSFDGMMDWILYTDALKSDNSYTNVQNFSAQINGTTAKWAAADPVHRLGVGMVWPGFNDSGVDGWGAGPRVIPYSPDFYRAAWDGMLKNNLDWVVIATFNDFTESTSIEPSRQLGYSLAITTSKYIAQLKGTQPVDPTVFQTIAQEYDHTPPVTTSTHSGQQGKNGWYVGPVQLNLSATDDQSGVATTYYSTDAGNTWETYTGPVSFSNDGKYAVEYYSVDYVGNKESVQRVNFDVDQTPPSVDISAPTTDAKYLDDQTVTVNFSVTDSLSGVDPSATAVTLDGQPTISGTSIPWYTLPLGSHVLKVTATDEAGNMVTQSVTFQTTTSISSMQQLVKLFLADGTIDNQGIANSLTQKLQNEDLQGFVNEVQAQRGKHIQIDEANDLLRDADWLLKN